MCGQHQACEAGLASHDATRELASIVAQQNQPLANHLQIAEIGLPEGACYHSLFVEFVGEFRVQGILFDLLHTLDHAFPASVPNTIRSGHFCWISAEAP